MKSGQGSGSILCDTYSSQFSVSPRDTPSAVPVIVMVWRREGPVKIVWMCPKVEQLDYMYLTF